MLRIGYLLVLLIAIFPLLPGILGMLLPAFNYIPVLNLHSFNNNAFLQVFNWPGVWQSLTLSLFSALLSTLLALIICFSILQTYWATKTWKRIEKLLAPLLALPHVAFAIGFLFLFSNTGWLARLIGTIIPEQYHLYWIAVPDQYALGLSLALAIKETPFLLLMSIPILNNLNIQQTLHIAHSLQYSTAQAWRRFIFPQWWKHIRFPLFAVVAYSASVVDVSWIIGPTNPPTFAVLVWQWFNQPDLNLLPRAAAGAFVLFILCSLLIALLWILERYFLSYQRNWLIKGRNNKASTTSSYLSKMPHPPLAKLLFPIIGIISLTTIPVLLIWTFAQRWSFPDFWPSSWSLRFWVSEWPYIQQTLLSSIYIALISSFCALVLAIIAHEYRHKYRFSLPMYIIALPMLVPQLSLLFGIQIVTLWLDHSPYYFWVLWAHCFFAFPYIYMTLDGPWKSFSTKLTQTAYSLGLSPIKTWFKVKMPILFNAIIFAWAVGISVSLAQYLPTQMLGAGRISTLTTEAVTLSSGHDRRIMALYALWQAILPFLFFALAFSANKWRSYYRNFTVSSSGLLKSQERLAKGCSK
ncbi:thiamine ABC transporter permease [Vibrio sp. S17_S38]|uniref:ABC transporter permease n=1 Tax=Vibrio sp. S17_S38 TaxID=2720229 RepID=UPI00168197F4|nr:thiamine ABC transporter permease [Vibrio sp. S17_S38]MBD1572982.1 thiamine ABC transporter permease [Vibrio sp. S17_S38]